MELSTEKSSAAAAEAEVSGGGGSAVRTAEALLRMSPVGLCLAALVVMLKNSEDNEFGSVSYSDLTPFRYLVYANGICAGYSLLSAFFTAVPRPSSLSRAWIVFFFDQTSMLTVIMNIMHPGVDRHPLIVRSGSRKKRHNNHHFDLEESAHLAETRFSRRNNQRSRNNHQ